MDALKSEMINWILSLKDESQVLKIFTLMKKSLNQKQGGSINTQDLVRQPGFGKHIFKGISDDFNEPIDDFKEYMP